ncbi:MAG: hypothetical protein HZA01_10035 [Nitrospinae bacterium]|nr:hypothetical protein [Nitrospinota bacterium]
MSFKMRSVFFSFLFLAVSAFLFSLGEMNAWAKDNDAVKKCGGCHKQYLEDWAPTKHGKIFTNSPQNALQARACEACHGDGADHIADAKKAADEAGGKVDLGLIRSLTKKSKLSAKEKDDVCLQCHRKEARNFLWMGSKHEASGLTVNLFYHISHAIKGAGVFCHAQVIEDQPGATV